MRLLCVASLAEPAGEPAERLLPRALAPSTDTRSQVATILHSALWAILYGSHVVPDPAVELTNLRQYLAELLELGGMLGPLLSLVAEELNLELPLVLNLIELLQRRLREATLEGHPLAAV